MSGSETQPQSLADKASFEVVWKLMAELGIGTIEVSFNGEGDSGDISDITACPPDAQPGWKPNNPANDVLIAAWNTRATALNQAMRVTPTGIMREDYQLPGTYDLWLKDLVCALTWPMLDRLDHDWVNNDGGYGTVTWELAHQTITLDLSIRITSTEEYEYDYDKYGQQIEED